MRRPSTTSISWLVVHACQLLLTSHAHCRLNVLASNALWRTSGDQHGQAEALHVLDGLRVAVQRQVEAPQPVVGQAVRAWHPQQGFQVLSQLCRKVKDTCGCLGHHDHLMLGLANKRTKVLALGTHLHVTGNRLHNSHRGDCAHAMSIWHRPKP